MKIGIFSGSFDPIHIGHAMMVSYLSQFCDLAALWLMPSPINPLKVDSTRTPAEHRLAMCRIVADKCPSVVVSDFEFSLPRPSYTYQTLRELKRSYPEHEFYLIIGSDNWIIRSVNSTYFTGLWYVCHVVPFMREEDRPRDTARHKSQFFNPGEDEFE